jgi:Predicted transcription factor, homolog of eukaryotic MBF1
LSRVGENIKQLRLQTGISTKVLAKKLGVAESFINELEAGRKVANEALINRISKVLGKDINDIGMSFEEQLHEEDNTMSSFVRESKTVKNVPKAKEVQDVWSDAFGSVLKQVPVYDYSLKGILETKLLPVQNNKIEGYSVDKVLYLQIQDDDMSGFRISKGDLAFAHQVTEVTNNAIFLLELNGERVIRQIKKLDNSKVLLISNRSSIRTETAAIKEIKVIAKLERIEIKL